MLQHENPKTMVGVSLIWLQKVQATTTRTITTTEATGMTTVTSSRGTTGIRTRHEARGNQNNVEAGDKLWLCHKIACQQTAGWLRQLLLLCPFVAATKISVYSIDYKRGRCNSRSRSRHSPVASRTRCCSCSCSWLEFGPTRIFASL